MIEPIAMTLGEKLRYMADWEGRQSLQDAADRIEELERQLATARQQERERCANRCKQHKERMDELGNKEAGAVAAFLEHTIRALSDEEAT